MLYISTSNKTGFQQFDIITSKQAYIFAIFVLIIYQSDTKMNTLGKRIQQLRKDKNLSQTELAKKIGVSYAQLSRYEIKDSQPPAEVLKKIADALDTSLDYLINGNKDDKAKASLKDAEVIRCFKEIDSLPESEKAPLIKIISGYIRDFKTKQTYAL